MDVIINLAWLGFLLAIALFLGQFVFAFIAMIFILPIVGINALVQKFKKKPTPNQNSVDLLSVVIIYV